MPTIVDGSKNRIVIIAIRFIGTLWTMGRFWTNTPKIVTVTILIITINVVISTVQTCYRCVYYIIITRRNVYWMNNIFKTIMTFSKSIGIFIYPICNSIPNRVYFVIYSNNFWCILIYGTPTY